MTERGKSDIPLYDNMSKEKAMPAYPLDMRREGTIFTHGLGPKEGIDPICPSNRYHGSRCFRVGYGIPSVTCGIPDMPPYLNTPKEKAIATCIEGTWKMEYDSNLG
jgi:hypothetical protein